MIVEELSPRYKEKFLSKLPQLRRSLRVAEGYTGNRLACRTAQ